MLNLQNLWQQSQVSKQDPESKQMRLLPSGRQVGLANAVRDQVRKREAREGERQTERESERA